MAYDAALDDLLGAKVRKYRMKKKKMFGGTCYLENDKMVCGVWKDNVIFRVGESEGEKALREKKALVFDMVGRPMKGLVMVEKKNIDEKNVDYWIELARKNVKKIKKKAK